MVEKKVQNRVTGKEDTVCIRLLKATEIEAFEQLHMALVQEINDKDTLNANSKEFSAKCINQETGFCLGGFVNGQLITYLMVYLPNEDSANLGVDIGLPKEELLQVAHFDQEGVQPSYRKNGLIHLMRKIAMDKLAKKGFNYFFSTISPKNIPSIRSAMNQGALIVKLSEKYGGKLRFTMQYLPKVNTSKEQQEVFHTDYAIQQNLLKQGWLGTSISKNGFISYHLGIISENHYSKTFQPLTIQTPNQTT